MPIELTQLAGEAIINASVIDPFDPGSDIPAMFTDFVRLRQALRGPTALIVEFGGTTNAPGAFSQIVQTLAHAADGIKISKAAGLAQPPIIIFVGLGEFVRLAAEAIGQEQYGGVQGQVCASYEEALALARARLSG